MFEHRIWDATEEDITSPIESVLPLVKLSYGAGFHAEILPGLSMFVEQ